MNVLLGIVIGITFSIGVYVVFRLIFSEKVESCATSSRSTKTN